MKNIDNTLKELFLNLNLKQKKVINERFGLTCNPRTLQAIGDDLGVTRERVRQIESQSKNKIADSIEENFSFLINNAMDILDNFDGVCEYKTFIKEIKKDNEINELKNIDNKISFIFNIAKKPLLFKENEDFNSFWYKNKDSKNKLFNYINKVIKFFKKENKNKIFKEKNYKLKFDDKNFENFIAISKKFGKNVFGEFGLKEWPEIEPKVIKDKAFLVLKKEEKPLHFEDIAKKIGRMGIDSKPAHVQTVHNELIKDDRFVLVGRGIYALSEHGYEGGTVKQVIAKILNNEGPLRPEEVVKLVNQKKILKKNTILLNLQNKKNFKKLDDGRYHIKEA